MSGAFSPATRLEALNDCESAISFKESSAYALFSADLLVSIWDHGVILGSNEMFFCGRRLEKIMKSPKNPSRFFQIAFLSGTATLLAGCPTTQGLSTGTQLGKTQARPTTAAQAQASAPAADMRAAPAATKQQAASASPSPAKVVVATAPVAAGAVATVSYLELVKLHTDDLGDLRKAYGKTVRVAVNGKGDIGYFAKKSDAITFVCKSGDKTLTANKATKGTIQGIVFQSQPWEGATVYHLKECQIVK